MAYLPVCSPQEQFDGNLGKMPAKAPQEGDTHEHIADAVLPEKEHPGTRMELEQGCGRRDQKWRRSFPSAEQPTAQLDFDSFEERSTHSSAKLHRAASLRAQNTTARLPYRERAVAEVPRAGRREG